VKLNATHAKKLQQYVDRMWGENLCDRCKGKQWSLTGPYKLVIQEKIMTTKTAVGGPGIALGALTCARCGYTMLLDLGLTGILPDLKDKESKPAPVVPAPNGKPYN